MERQWRARVAGLRTNALVATGATLFMLLSAYGFDTGLHKQDGLRVADPTRVAVQIRARVATEQPLAPRTIMPEWSVQEIAD